MTNREKKDRTNTYYVLVPTCTHDIDELNPIEEMLVEYIGAFTNNMYIFRQYEKFYQPLLESNCSYIVTKYEDVTLKQLFELVGTDFNYIINENDEMLLDETPFNNDPVLFTYRMLETIDEYCYDGADPLDDVFLHEYIQAYVLIKESKYIKDFISDRLSGIIDFAMRYTLAIKKTINEVNSAMELENTFIPLGEALNDVSFDDLYNWTYQREFILRVNTELLNQPETG